MRGVQGQGQGDFYDRRECEGPIAEQIEEAYQFVVKNMRVGTKIVNSQRQEVYELPLSAVREAICNAAFHRDYLEPSNVFVAFFDDRLEITSPGGLVKDFTIEQAESGISKIRNMGLAAALEYMKDVEGWGGGVSRYFEKCAEFGLPPPKVEELEGGFFRVTFFRNARGDGITYECKEDNRAGESKGMSKGKSKGISRGRNTAKSSDRIISLLAEDPTLRQSAIAERVGLSLAGVEKIMRHLRTEGKLIREGSARNGRWKVV